MILDTLCEPRLPAQAADLSTHGRARLLAGARQEILVRTYTGAFAYPPLTLLIAWSVGLADDYPRAVALVVGFLTAVLAVRVLAHRRAQADTTRRSFASDVFLLLGVTSSMLFASAIAFAYVVLRADASITAGFVTATGVASVVTMIAATHVWLARVWVAGVVLPGVVAFVIEGSHTSLILMGGYLIYMLILHRMIDRNYAAYWHSQVTGALLDEQAQELARLSRLAGMNEIATNVLHDVGNALTTVEASTSCLEAAQAGHPSHDLVKLASLLGEHAHDLPAFMAEDGRCAAMVAFVRALADASTEHANASARELARARTSLEHVEVIVRRQQDIARGTGDPEPCDLRELVEHALGLSALGGARVEFEHDAAVGLRVLADRHRAPQILVNLLENARDATRDATRPARVQVRAFADEGAGVIEIHDNGCGIPADVAARIFSRGFTTKTHGHGFGLHGSFALAQSMGGELSFASPGVGHGATFTLRLAVA
jgi:signal transduction histidine kinase